MYRKKSLSVPLLAIVTVLCVRIYTPAFLQSEAMARAFPTNGLSKTAHEHAAPEAVPVPRASAPKLHLVLPNGSVVARLTHGRAPRHARQFVGLIPHATSSSDGRWVMPEKSNGKPLYVPLSTALAPEELSFFPEPKEVGTRTLKRGGIFLTSRRRHGDGIGLEEFYVATKNGSDSYKGVSFFQDYAIVGRVQSRRDWTS